jgi:N-acetylneuraminate synthase
VEKSWIPKNMFVFEMANNHMGDVEHGLRIIREISDACRDFRDDFSFGFKLQYRNLDTFIHPDYQGREDIKYVKRFSETRLSKDQFKTLKDEMVKLGFVSICTPFDEDSVGLIEEQGYEIIKIASCSFTDWPLLERIAATDKPVIASTAAASLDEIDKIVTFFEHRNKKLCLMHCVGEYPTATSNLELNQIDVLKNRYPEVKIGYSTHEDPNNFEAVKIAVGKGAVVFERHVGVKTDKYDLNGYSSNPEQVKMWLQAAKEAFAMCSTKDNKREFSAKEIDDLRGLRRGVFAKTAIKKGEKLTSTNSFYAIPNIEGQILANDTSKYTEYVAQSDIEPNAPVMLDNLNVKDLREKVLEIIESTRSILIDSKVSLPNKLEFELSHHYGIDTFNDWGATIINCINREYCKKLIILVPGQKHPMHHHKKKEETFHVIYGDVTINLDGEEKTYTAGDMVVVERGVKHSFRSDNGAIFEEISTTHYKDDSFYEEEEILLNKNRKTEMTFWADWLYKTTLS